MQPLEGHPCPKTIISLALSEEDICHAPLSDLGEEPKLTLGPEVLI
jgi:hypothetical protein